jgi:hypothetical protein
MEILLTAATRFPILACPAGVGTQTPETFTRAAVPVI